MKPGDLVVDPFDGEVYLVVSVPEAFSFKWGWLVVQRHDGQLFSFARGDVEPFEGSKKVR